MLISEHHTGAKYFINTFEITANKTPDAIAISFDSCLVSYGELQNLAKGYAIKIAETAESHITGVVLNLPRSVELIAMIIACQYVGLPYIPIDLKTTPNRVMRIVNSAPYMLVTDSPIPQFTA